MRCDAGVSPLRIQGNERELQRLVRNLLANAGRYGRGHVRVELCRRGPHAVLTIEDDGRGIPLADRRRVFDRFTRLDASRSRDEGGSGLGLALAKGITDAHGGEIRIEDSSLGGARIVVVLPCDGPVRVALGAG